MFPVRGGKGPELQFSSRQTEPGDLSPPPPTPCLAPNQQDSTAVASEWVCTKMAAASHLAAQSVSPIMQSELLGI